MLLFVYTTTRKRFVIFTCRHFKLSWNTTALSQSNCSNFSRSSISMGNTTSDISNLLCVIHDPLGNWNLRQFCNITSGIYAKHHVPCMLLFVYSTTRKGFVIFTCRYFKLSWNTTALSQSNCRNFSRSSISIGNSMICSDIWHKYNEWYFLIVIRNFETISKYP